MNRNWGTVILALALIFLAGYLGYALGTVKPPVQKNGVDMAPKYQQDNARIGPPSIIQSQQAAATGKIIRVEGNGVTIQGDDGQTIAFSLAPKFAIYTLSQTPASKSATPTTSTDKNDIKINQQALINLELQGTQYFITTITYFPSKK